MVKNIFSTKIVGDIRSKTPRFVVYAIGQYDYHLMDWAGMNCRKIKIPNQPKQGFKTIKSAQKFIKKWDKKNIDRIEGEGSFYGDYYYGSYWEAKEDVKDIKTQKDWDEYRTNCKNILKPDSSHTQEGKSKETRRCYE